VNAAIDAAFATLASAGRLHPMSRPDRAGIEWLRDIAYRDTGHPAHRLDIYRATPDVGRRPVLLYIHGGGFRILSKAGFRALAVAYAKAGFVVVAIDYRLAPEHRFPAAHQDAAAAYGWVCRRIAAYGGDRERIVVAGDSAGANLALTLALCTAIDRVEPWAAALRDEPPPAAAIVACGLLQVGDPLRFGRLPRPPAWVARDRIEEIAHAYLGEPDLGAPDRAALADPLCVIEACIGTRTLALAPTFIPVGGADPVLDDSRRLAAALHALHVPHELAVYARQGHAFNTMMVRAEAQRCFDDGLRFVAAHAGSAW
jgi:acetyl esterase